MAVAAAAAAFALLARSSLAAAAAVAAAIAAAAAAKHDDRPRRQIHAQIYERRDGRPQRVEQMRVQKTLRLDGRLLPDVRFSRRRSLVGHLVSTDSRSCPDVAHLMQSAVVRPLDAIGTRKTALAN